jgi:hypothetical protein
MNDTLQLIAPPGYGPVVPFDKHSHGRLGLLPERRYAWCARLNNVFINIVEFARAATEYPIAFVREQSSHEFVPVAILGLRDRENLFVDADGGWRWPAYVPAYCRRHPFCVAQVTDGAEPKSRKLICVQPDQLSPDGAPLFDARSSPTTEWDAVQRLIETMESARQATRVLCKRLEALELLVPFDAVASAPGRQTLHLQGMYRVDEQKLATLPMRNLKTLLNKGELRAVYAHLISLENFARLLDLGGARDGR